MACLTALLEDLFAVQGAAARARWAGASPSMAYSILRKTISISSGLRAGPAAPEPAKGRGENNDAGEEEEHGHGEDGHVLRPEDLARGSRTSARGC